PDGGGGGVGGMAQDAGEGFGRPGGDLALLKNPDGGDHSFSYGGAHRMSQEQLVDWRESPWDGEYRRPSHNNKRKALRRAVLRQETRARREQAADPPALLQPLESL